ncbi:hypothetical protein HanXRQr2_Chr01g0028261 [Helianthus annuus]|uniref:Uncharacterized protein n=1 Tax=Helianthus annuus TaxID=4232 RepID=A0A251VPM1_HELAN|nr:hypothetical protein HanXRQr2_Chr01g0028261 [Helianthus annuus]
MFSREAGLYMWRTIPFDKMGWENVSPPHKKAIMSHLRVFRHKLNLTKLGFFVELMLDEK